MAKDKDRTLNPAAAQRKLDKAKALKKGKAQVAAQRTERLAHRNPHRLESQIADLHALKESSGGKLSGRDAKQLEELERDVARVRKARETLGEGAPVLGGQRGRRESGRGDRGGGGARGGGGGRAGYNGLGKRHRSDDGGQDSESEETDEDVRRIPWPKDTPPPIPRPDRRRQQQQQQQQHRSEGTSANREPLGAERYPDRSNNTTAGDEEAHVPDTSLPSKPTSVTAAPAAVKKTYESKAQVRDLRKEATARFMPSAVKRKIDATKGVGARLLEEEEVSRLEKEGYGPSAEEVAGGTVDEEAVRKEDERDEQEEEERKLREEEEAFQKALGPGSEEGKEEEGARKVEIEDVSDEDL